MLRAITVSNFRSLGQNVRIELGPFTVLAGTNGSGKSTVLDVIQLLADVLHIGLEGAVTKRHGIAAMRRFQETGHPFDISVHAEVATPSHEAQYSFVLKGDRAEEYRIGREEALVVDRASNESHHFRVEEGRWVSGPPDLRPHVAPLTLALPLLAGDARFAPLGDELRRMAVYSIFPDQLRNPQKYDPAKPMHRLGENWVSILKDQARDTWQPDLVEVLHRLTGDIDDIRVRPVAGFLTAQFHHTPPSPESGKSPRGRKQRWFDATQESDGTLRVAGILSALLQHPRPSVIAMEEPELTVHPGALRILVDYMREATLRGQVVITTHSPDLLDLVEVEELRIVERVGGLTRVSRLDPQQKAVVRDRLLSLGDVLRVEGLQTELSYE